MEQPQRRGAAAAESGDGPGRRTEPPGDSAAWNGNCGAAGPEEEDDDRDLPRPGPERSCRCGGEPAAPPSPAARRRDGSCGLTCRNRAAAAPAPQPLRGQEEGEEDGAGEDGAGKGARRTRRRQRHRSAPKEEEESGQREGGAGRRQRPARKRSRGDGAEPAQEPAGWRGLLAQALRLGAEAGGRLLCSCCRFGARDLGWARAGVRSWGRRVGQRARSGSLRAARWLRAAAGLFLRLLWMLCALLLLLLVLLLGGLRLCWRAGAAALAAGADRLGRSPRAARLLALLDAAALRGTRGLLGASRPCRYLWAWLRRRPAPPWAGRTGAAAPGPDAAEEVRRLLAMAELPEGELNPFQVLGVEAAASDAELRKAYRRLAVLVHPDKNEHPGAEAAFKVLRAAWDAVGSPERRKEYEMKRLAESELTRSVGEFLSRLQDDLAQAMNTMLCSKCQGRHRRFEMDREPPSARYCAECGALHAAEEGDLWAESSLLGLKITYFAVMGGKVYDITEWAGCQRVGIPDTHRVPYHISFGSRGPAPGGRQRSGSKGGPASAADLQEFFARVFQGGSGPVPGGPFPPPPAPPAAAASPAGAARPEGPVPRGDAKHKRRKKTRRPLQR
ncbi:LOW QUALITY PROTEIN: dnaJ homolog subfamily C member 14 [Chlamydotis macqueenii]